MHDDQTRSVDCSRAVEQGLKEFPERVNATGANSRLTGARTIHHCGIQRDLAAPYCRIYALLGWDVRVSITIESPIKIRLTLFLVI